MSLEEVVANLVQKVERRFYGKYRGFVVDNADPEHLGRLKVKVPGVLGNDVVTGWAMPCAPYGGNADQGFLFIPDIKAGVWIEFEEGDLEFPIWVGTFWSKPGGESELPKPNDADGTEQDAAQDPPTRKIIKTKKGHTIQLEDADNEEMVTIVEAKNKHLITMNKDGIKITDGSNKHEVILGKSGITVSDKVGSNDIKMEGSGVTIKSNAVKVGGSSAVEPFVLGQTLSTILSTFIIALNTHTHVGNIGAPTTPPAAPMQLNIAGALSKKHKVE